jgi:hypothetical protein
VLADYRSAPISDKERALFAFVDKVNRDSIQVRQQDIDALKGAGWSEEAIYDAVTVCALFNFYNRWIDATGVQDMPEAAYEMSGQRLKQHGYLQRPATSVPGPAAPGRTSLGREVFRCRLVSGASAEKRAGFSLTALDHYLITLVLFPCLAFAIACVLTLLIFMPVAGNDGGPQEDVAPWGRIIVVAILFIPAYAALFWLKYKLPRKNCLVLFERGIQVRKNFRMLEATFEEIEEIQIGNKMDQATRWLLGQSELLSDSGERIAAAALTFRLKNGQSKLFKALLLDFDDGDLQTFFDQLRAKVPVIEADVT